jgi:hypothetical protein
MDTPTPLDRAVAEIGLTALARKCKVSHQAVRKWQAAGRMPRTEWTGETDYSHVIQRLTADRVTREQLLQPWPQRQPAPPLANMAAAVGRAA